MEKLELKHLVPYLPYDMTLKVVNKQEDRFGLAVVLKGVTKNYNDQFVIYTNHSTFYDWELKPRLRKLTDYDNVNSEAMNSLNIDLGDMLAIEELARKQKGYRNCPYGVMEILFRNHIDVFGLIEKGLAVSLTDALASQKL